LEEGPAVLADEVRSDFIVSQRVVLLGSGAAGLEVNGEKVAGWISPIDEGGRGGGEGDFNLKLGIQGGNGGRGKTE